MCIDELKIYLDLNPESKSKVLDKYAMKFNLGYFFVDSEDGHCYLLDRNGNEKDVSLVYEIYEAMIPKDIQKIVIPNGVTKIESWVFAGCADLTSIIIPNSITNIGRYAFYYCNKLTHMTIPNNVWYIGYNAFRNCTNLKSLIFKNKTMKQVKAMESYPFGIKDESVIKAEFS